MCNGPTVTLNWSGSADSVLGYHVYRAASATGPFARLTGSLVTGTSFVDTNAPAGAGTYMVRAVKLQTTPSGTYFNPSEGIFAAVGSVPLSIQLQARWTNDGIMLSWNSFSGTVYRVQAKNDLGTTNWSDLGGVTATGTNTSWTDPNSLLDTQRFYRVASP